MTADLVTPALVFTAIGILLIVLGRTTTRPAGSILIGVGIIVAGISGFVALAGIGITALGGAS